MEIPSNILNKEMEARVRIINYDKFHFLGDKSDMCDKL